MEMIDYNAMTLSELYVAWINNWKVLRTGIREIIPDSEPMPDPRGMVQQLIEMPEDVWVSAFSDDASAELRRTMDIQELLANVQLENIAILHAALNKGEANAD